MRSVTVVDDVIVHEEGGDAFLLHPASGRYYGLNRSGLIVWNALVRGDDPVAELMERWPNQPPAVLRSDADAILETLLEAGLVNEDDATADERTP